MTNFLNDKRFLRQIDRLRIKEQYVRLTILSWSEESISEIQGKVLSGSVTLDGSSSLRRTANLTLLTDSHYNDLTTLNNDIAINKKVKMELGILNTVPSYFYQTENDSGVLENHEINYQEKYGNIVWFPLGIYVMFDPNIAHTGEGITLSVTLKDKMCLLNGDVGGVIPAAVTLSETEYIDEQGKTKVEIPTMYQIIEEVVNHFGDESLSNIIITDLDTKAKQVVKYMGKDVLYYVTGTPRDLGIKFYRDYDAALAAAKYAGGTSQNIVYYESGQDIGFIFTDFTYPGELTCNPGETVTSVLDNIINVLGNFEYFYDIEGHFRFQEIKNYLNTTYTTEILNNLNTSPDYKIDFSQGMSVYTFDGAEMILSISNTPVYGEIKNDFVVWGTRLGVDQTKYPIRYHLAIDERPKVQGHDSKGAYFGIHYNMVLYQDDFKNYLARKANTSSGERGQTIYTRDYREELYYQGIEALQLGTNTSYYFTELYAEWPKIFDLKEQVFKSNIVENPSSIDFFLDIIDTGSEVGRYGVPNIGRRSVVVEEDEINSVFEKDIPDVVFLNKDELSVEELRKMQQEMNARGQDWYQIDSIFSSLLATGGVLNSAYYRVTQLLYQHTNMDSAISISTLPIYYLEPNTRITINDSETGVFGDYIISTISLSLDVSSTMEISAYKAIEQA